MARILLPHVSEGLVGLSLVGLYNAQGPYILRVIAPGGVFPSLRTLGISFTSGNCTNPYEGHRWREEEDRTISEVEARQAARFVDGTTSPVFPESPQVGRTGTYERIRRYDRE